MAALALAALAALALFRPALAVYRLARMPAAARRHYPAALWARIRWRWLARNAGLAYIDHHHRRQLRPRIPFTTAVRVQPVPVHKLRYPAARFRTDAYGWQATVRTIPKVGRAQVADAAESIADAWRCHRVQVTQAAPGRVVIRGCRRDPLTEPYAMAAAPAAVFGAADGPPQLLYLGRDAWGTHRSVPLANLPAIAVGGLPGYGKSVLITSLLCQLAPSPVVDIGLICDGKGSADFEPWGHVAQLVGDDLDAAAQALATEADAMRRRLADMPAATGHRNGWAAGPSREWPLRLTIVDECHTYLDLDSVKGDRQAETAVRECRHALSQLVRKGRSAMWLTVLATQKQTGDSTPTAIRDNIPLSLCFATRTREAAVAALGDAIRDHPDKCPTTLSTPELVGVCTALLRTGLDPYTQLRTPLIGEDQAAAVAAALTPGVFVPQLVPPVAESA